LQSQLNLLVLLGPLTPKQVQDSAEASIRPVQLGFGDSNLDGYAQH